MIHRIIVERNSINPDCSDKGDTTRNGIPSWARVASSTKRGMSSWTCCPRENMQGTTTISVAPRRTHSLTAAETSGAANSM